MIAQEGRWRWTRDGFAGAATECSTSQPDPARFASAERGQALSRRSPTAATAASIQRSRRLSDVDGGKKVVHDGYPGRHESVIAFVESEGQELEGKQAMKYARLGDTGLVVSRLSFGSMTVGSGQGTDGQRVPEDRPEGGGRARRRAAWRPASTCSTPPTCTPRASPRPSWAGRWAPSARKWRSARRRASARRDFAAARGALGAPPGHAGREQPSSGWAPTGSDLFVLHQRRPVHAARRGPCARCEDLVALRARVRYVGLQQSGRPGRRRWPSTDAEAEKRRWARVPLRRRCTRLLQLVGARRGARRRSPFMKATPGVGIMVWSPLAGGFPVGVNTPERIRRAARAARLERISISCRRIKEQAWETDRRDQGKIA